MSNLVGNTLNTDTKKVAATMFCVLGCGVLAVSMSLPNRETILHGLLWAGAWSSVGWFLGFLFGIPRYLSTDTARKPAASNAEPATIEAKALREKETMSAAEMLGPSLTVNTNLEQISDWLTKIIVGVSLVESQALLENMKNMASYMARSMIRTETMASLSAVSASTPASAAPAASSTAATSASNIAAVVGSAESFAYAIMLYFLITGLLGSYLLTRLFLQQALNKAATQE